MTTETEGGCRCGAIRYRITGEPVLQLITCGGTFNPEARSYEANVVVTAVPLRPVTA